MHKPEEEEIYYDFNIYFDSLITNSIDLDGKIILICNKGNVKKIYSEEAWKAGKRHTLIAKWINLQQPLYYNKFTGDYKSAAKTQISWYINDSDYSQPVFIGFININLSQIVNQKRDKHGKIPSQTIEIELDKWDYGDTSVKITITAKKNLKGPK